MWAFLMVIASVLSVPNGGKMQVAEQGVADDGIELVSVEHFPEYVTGMPVWMAVTLRADHETAFHQLVFADLLSLRSCLGLEVTGPDGSHQEIPTPFVDEEMGRKGQSLMPGETHRMLADLSPLFGTAMRPGEYQVRLRYMAPHILLVGKPFRIRFRAPDSGERVMLDWARPTREQAPNWALWMQSCRAAPLPLERIDAASPGALTFVLHNLFCGSTPLSTVPPQSLERFATIPVPERRALEAELQVARGDRATAVRTRDDTLRQTPGLAWWMSALDRDGMYLPTFSERPK